MQKKVTLSLSDKVYDPFKKYCNDNAIMLSKKIELVMVDILKNSANLNKKRGKNE